MIRDVRRDAKEIFNAGLKAADPEEAVKRALSLNEKGELVAGERSYDLKHFENIFVVGAGKAAVPMAHAVEDILNSRINKGHITTKYGHSFPLRIISVTEAGHPIPDESGLSGTKSILKLLEGADKRTLIFALISGGGSALMPLPVSGITLSDKQKTTQVLMDCGASIYEINTIRKHISGIKGGKLARAAFPATLITLILSDVIGDDLDVIASGPTVPDRSTFGDCMEIVKRYQLSGKIPLSVVGYLEKGKVGKEAETPKKGDPIFDRTATYIVGSSGLSIVAAKDTAARLGYNALILSSFIEGETREVARVHAAIIKEILKTGNPVSRPACVISGGETTVTIHGKGLGGRNMEFTLAAALDIDGLEGVTILSAGTDGTDGPTDAAGAIADGTTAQRAKNSGYHASEYLRNNDSYNFFKEIDDLFITGPTMTNVMDLRILLVL